MLFLRIRVVSGRFYSPLSQTHAILVSSSQIRAENVFVAWWEKIWTFDFRFSESFLFIRSGMVVADCLGQSVVFCWSSLCTASWNDTYSRCLRAATGWSRCERFTHPCFHVLERIRQRRADARVVLGGIRAALEP